METPVPSKSDSVEHTDKADDFAAEREKSAEGAPLRTKTLPFPVPQQPRDAQGGGQYAPFLVELARETTWRFIASAPGNPDQANDTAYAAEPETHPADPQSH